MRIALDGHSLGAGASGNSRYVLGLLEGLAQITAQTSDELLLYVPAELAQPLPAASGGDGTLGQAPATHTSPRLQLSVNERQRLIPLRSRSAISRLAWELPRRLRHDEADVAHFQYIGPVSSPCPLVIAVHDVSFCLARDILGRRTTWRMRLTTKRALRAASIVLTPSEWSARMVARFFPETRSRIRVVPLGVSADFSPTANAADSEIRAELGLPEEYFLYVGRRQLRKNISGLAESYARAIEQAPELPSLVLVGPSGEKDQTWRSRFEESRFQDRVVLLDDVADAALPAVYRGARLFLFPCRYEGFGLPVLEAMACGVPAIVADEGGLPELVGAAGTRLDPTDPEAWAHALVTLGRDASPMRESVACGLEIARGYSWRATAEGTHAAYAAAYRQ